MNQNGVLESPIHNIEDLNQALQQFRDLYNHQWLIERHNHRPPAQVRQDLLGTGAAA